MSHYPSYRRAFTAAVTSCCLVLMFLTVVQAEDEPVVLPTIDLFDTNGDGVIDPFESMDAILVMQEEIGGEELTMEAITRLVERWHEEEREDVARLFEDLDLDEDGALSRSEMDDELLEYLDVIDSDGDGTITPAEMLEAGELEPLFYDESEIQEEVASLFLRLDLDRSGSITQAEAGSEWPYFMEMDFDLDDHLSRAEVVRAYRADNKEATFEIEGDTARIEGVLTTRFPADVLRLLFEHPEVRTLELSYILGSLDDDANLRACRYIRRHGLDTHVPSGGLVASGGTDLFLSGRHRTCGDRAMVGVHSWSWMGDDGDQLPRDHEEHRIYLDFYEEMGIPEAFYWFTLEAASADEVHWMSLSELRQYECLNPPAVEE